jgi:hypothetical protein
MNLVLWIVIGLSLFAWALALQMRMLISVGLRRALAAKFGGDFNAPRWRQAAAFAGKIPPQDEPAQLLADTYAVPVGHLRMARIVSAYAPVVALLAAIALRFLSQAR